MAVFSTSYKHEKFIKIFLIKLLVFIPLGLIILTGCAGTKKEINPELSPVYPKPPMKTRVQYLTSFSSTQDLDVKTSWFKKLLALEVLQDKTITKPYGVAYKNGKIYICDTVTGTLDIFDLIHNKFEVTKLGGRGTLQKPVNLTVNDKGDIFIADRMRNDVIMFDSSLQFKKNFHHDSLTPSAIATWGDTLYIANMGLSKVEMWSIKSNHKLGDLPPGPREGKADSTILFRPVGLAVGIAGDVYVTDMGAFQIKRFTKEGQFVRTYGHAGMGTGGFSRPKGIAVSRDSILYTIDAAFGNAQMWNNQGQLLMYIANMTLPAGIFISYENEGLELFKKYVIKGLKLEYLIFVTNQYGPEKVNVYGFVTEQPDYIAPKQKPESENLKKEKLKTPQITEKDMDKLKEREGKPQKATGPRNIDLNSRSLLSEIPSDEPLEVDPENTDSTTVKDPSEAKETKINNTNDENKP